MTVLSECCVGFNDWVLCVLDHRVHVIMFRAHVIMCHVLCQITECMQ